MVEILSLNAHLVTNVLLLIFNMYFLEVSFPLGTRWNQMKKQKQPPKIIKLAAVLYRLSFQYPLKPGCNQDVAKWYYNNAFPDLKVYTASFLPTKCSVRTIHVPVSIIYTITFLQERFLQFVPVFTGPIASILTNRYGCRATTIAGSILAALGFVLSLAAPNLYFLYFSFGILSGNWSLIHGKLG